MAENGHTQLLVIGAGPYGLSTAAYAQRQGMEIRVLGHPMSFWRENMPQKMMLRSGPDWHMDVAQEYTMMAFLEERGVDPAEVSPIPISLFLEYADWFRERASVEVDTDLVENLTKPEDRFEATLQSGRKVTADMVVAAPGISHFGVIPDWIEGSLSPDKWTHTCDLVQFDDLHGKRVLIVGGRQSAFEWAALLADGEAAEVHVVHRHDPPDFSPADWSYVDPLMDLTVEIPAGSATCPQTSRRQSLDASGQKAGSSWNPGSPQGSPALRFAATRTHQSSTAMRRASKSTFASPPAKTLWLTT